MAQLFPLILVFAESSDPIEVILLAGPLAGAAFFFWIFNRYRNIDKRHSYEHSASVKSAVTKNTDTFVKTVEGSQKASVSNGNYQLPTWRVGQPRPLELGSGFLLKLFKKK